MTPAEERDHAAYTDGYRMGWTLRLTGEEPHPELEQAVMVRCALSDAYLRGLDEGEAGKPMSLLCDADRAS